MDTCTRGFSYMAETRVEIPDLQFIEGSELERTWRNSQRERMRQREQKIWEEFVSEQDAVAEISKDDPYQFLEQLPPEFLQNLMERELKKMQKEEMEIEAAILEETKDQNDLSLEYGDVGDAQPSVTFAEVQQDCDMFHIFDDDNDENDISGPEDEVLTDTLDTPCTVREKDDKPVSVVSTADSSEFDGLARSGKSENVSILIESSIYCAKVRDLRQKIIEELLSIITTTKTKTFVDIEREDLMKMKKRSSEFCTRFNRIHMYQLQRQLHDLKRHNSKSLPFAKHTQFQSQMVRVVSLHQNMLQALQVFHKSIEQTAFLNESVDVLLALSQLLREAGCAGAAMAPPADLPAAHTLYDDDTQATCENFDMALKEYSAKIAEVLGAYENSPNNRTGRNNTKEVQGRKKLMPNVRKAASKANAESKLSMYALEGKPSFRINLHPKPCVSKENLPSGTSINSKRVGSTATSDKAAANSNKDAPKSTRKTPRSRRPLMRDPSAGGGQGGQGRARRVHREADIETMVETVGACKSGHVSAESSPKRSDNFKSPKSFRSKESSPRALNLTPRSNRTNPSPRSKESPKLTPKERMLKSAKPPPIRSPKGLMREVALKSPVKALKQDKIPEESNNVDSEFDPAVMGTIRVQTKMKSPRDTPRLADGNSPRKQDGDSKDCEVSRILKSLCGDTVNSTGDRVIGAKNAQLICVNGSGSRQTSTPQLLRILEETIQKKTPRQLINQKPLTEKQKDRLRMTFNIPERTAESLFHYRTRFVQHMLASPMYANSTIGKPWEVIGSVSDTIIDSLLLNCVKEMELQDVISELYERETC